MNRFISQSLLIVSLFFVLSSDAMHIIIYNKTNTKQTINFEYRLDQLYHHPKKPQKAFVPHTTNHSSQDIAPQKTVSITLSHPQTCTQHYCTLDTNLKNDGFIKNKRRINIMLSTSNEKLFHESSLVLDDNQTITCTVLENEITITLT